MGDIELKQNEVAVLRCLKELSEDHSIYTRTVVHRTNLTFNSARRAIKSLERKKLVRLVRGLFNEDGLIAGSGYSCTKAGREFNTD